MKKAAPAPALEVIESRIFVIRGHRVMLDADLAPLYAVSTKRLNEQVKRNSARFPADFMFQLTEGEKADLVVNHDNLGKLRFSKTLPYVFTEHGAIMLASVLNSPIAVQSSLLVVRAFVKMREAMIAHKELARRLDDMEKKYDHKFAVVFDALRKLMEPPPVPKKRPIGFITPKDDE